MSDGFDVLVDSDAFVGKIYKNDQHYPTANRIFAYLKQAKASIVTTNLVVMETATVLSHRDGQTVACAFLQAMQRGDIPVIRVSDQLEAEAFSIFSRQTKKGTSVTDCANVAVVRHLQIPRIFSFDKVYRKRFKLSTVELATK